MSDLPLLITSHLFEFTQSNAISVSTYTGHFYNFIYFTNPILDNYMKRFVRDFMHYNDSIFCAAGKIVRSLQQEAIERGFSLDEEGGGGYSSLHVRRSDLQYKEVLISEERWYVAVTNFCDEMVVQPNLGQYMYRSYFFDLLST